MGNNYCCSSIIHSSVYIHTHTHIHTHIHTHTHTHIHIHIQTSLISLLVTMNSEATVAQPTIPWQFLLLRYLLGA